MSTKCDNCKRSISKTSPGVECSKCESIFHLNTKCTGLNNKQIAALRVASSLEWTCLQCQNEAPKRSSSIIVPEDNETDEEDANVQISANKLLSNISKEVEKAIKKEMRELHESLQFQSFKLDEMTQCIEEFKKTIKSIERKNVDLTNRNTNLEIRVGAMEQRLHELEQEKLNKFIEISNVETANNDEVKTVIEGIASKLQQPKQDIKGTRRLQERNGHPSNIIVELRDEESQANWLTAAKTQKILISDVKQGQNTNGGFVYVREAMTKTNKQLFWNVKQELKNKLQFKYVWFKRGLVRARVDDNEKIFTIRNMKDLQSIVESQSITLKHNK